MVCKLNLFEFRVFLIDGIVKISGWYLSGYINFNILLLCSWYECKIKIKGNNFVGIVLIFIIVDWKNKYVVFVCIKYGVL